MKRWKRFSVFCFVAALATKSPATAYAGSPEFARTAEEWAGLKDNVMEYGELADLIHEYNVTVMRPSITAVPILEMIPYLMPRMR